MQDKAEFPHKYDLVDLKKIVMMTMLTNLQDTSLKE